jgi:hypothetical protein
MCNVAPLLPPSMKIEENKSLFMEAIPQKSKAFVPDEPKPPQKPPSSTIVSADVSHFEDDVQIIEDDPKPTPIQQAPIPPNIPLQELPPQPMIVDGPPSTPEYNTFENVEGKKKKDKEHKKDRKDKDGKTKKKKDKKDKREKKGSDGEISKKRLKKEKKEKRRERERQASAAAAMMSEGSNIFSINSESKDHSDSSAGSVPRLTLKLGSTSSGSPRPETPDTGNRKL